MDATGLDWFLAAVDDAGGEVEDGRVVLARNVSSEGRSRAWVGGASVPVSRLADTAEPLVAVHGQSDQHRLLRQRAQRDALDRFGGEPVLALAAAYTALHARLEATERELDEVVASARERAREADLLRFGLGEIEAVDPKPGEDAQLAADEARLGYADALRTAAEQAREALSSEAGDPDALGAASAARTLLEGVREHDPEAGALADRLAEITYLLSDLAADVASYAAGRGRRPGPAGRRLRAEGGADRADPEVRRDRRGGAGLVRDLGRPTARPRRHRRSHRGAAGRAAVAAGRARRGGADPVGRPQRGGGQARPARSPRSWRCWPCPTPGSRSRSPSTTPSRRRATRRPAAARSGRQAVAQAHRERGRRGRVPARRQHRLRAATAAQGRLRRRAVPGDARPRGGAGRHQPGADVRVRRGRRRGRRDRRGRGRPQAGPARRAPPRSWW